MMAQFGIWILFTIGVIDGVTVCPYNWHEYGGQCYFFLRSHATTWEEASRGCKGRGGELASIHNVNESDFIRKRIGEDRWIGLSQISSDAPNQWSDGTPMNYQNWGYHEPNNAVGSELCVYMSRVSGWNHDPCSLQLPSVCKLKPGDVTTCPDTWQEYGGQCYSFHSLDASWEEASSVCKDYGGKLTSIHNENEYNFILGQMSGGSWIGLSQVRPDALYQWTDETPLEYQNWEPGEPNNAMGSEPCVYMSKDGGWNDHSCSLQLPSVCKLIPGDVTGCPDNWQAFGGQCYYFVSDDTSWESASIICKLRDGDLASIHNVNEHNFIHGKISGGSWIGLSQTSSDAPYQWTDATPMNYQNWEPGEPNTRRGLETCVHISKDGGWIDLSCSVQLPYVCKHKPVAGVVTWADDDLPRIVFTKYDFEASWMEANRFCSNINSTLASIHSPSQSMAILKYWSGGLWIGLSTKTSDGSYQWIDKSPKNFVNWFSFEPDNHDRTESCVQMSNMGFWHARSCSTRLRFVCMQSFRLPV